jgi:hypothetical protein
LPEARICQRVEEQRRVGAPSTLSPVFKVKLTHFNGGLRCFTEI